MSATGDKKKNIKKLIIQKLLNYNIPREFANTWLSKLFRYGTYWFYWYLLVYYTASQQILIRNLLLLSQVNTKILDRVKIPRNILNWN